MAIQKIKINSWWSLTINIYIFYFSALISQIWSFSPIDSCVPTKVIRRLFLAEVSMQCMQWRTNTRAEHHHIISSFSKFLYKQTEKNNKKIMDINDWGCSGLHVLWRDDWFLLFKAGSVTVAVCVVPWPCRNAQINGNKIKSMFSLLLIQQPQEVSQLWMNQLCSFASLSKTWRRIRSDALELAKEC